MPNIHVFADEAGCFKFQRIAGASKYFILTTIKTDTCDVGTELLDLKRSLVRRGIEVGDKLHSSSDKQAVRNEVFAVIQRHEIKIDATILEKSKAQPQTRIDDPTFYQYAWFYHAKYLTPRICHSQNDVLVTAAALETKAGKAAFKSAFNNALQQTFNSPTLQNRPPNATLATAFPMSSADPCLWAADYCAWAIQRKWEYDDRRSFDLIEDKVRSQYDLWRIGNRHYY